MSLMIGTGPFGPHPAGTFDAGVTRPERVLYLEDSPRRVRVVFDGETVADSRRVKLLHETGHLPVYYFPEDDVRDEHLVPSDHRTRCPIKGEASYWTVRAGDRVAENAVWAYPEPIEDAPPLGGHRAFDWDRMDAWYEEDEQVFVHPRDPYHRTDTLRSTRHIRVSLDDTVLAESDRPVLLFETGLPTRYYLDPDDVRLDLLEPTDTKTRCPYKGVTSRYWSARVGDINVDDAAWCYGLPTPGHDAIAGRIAFYGEKVRIEVDGENVG